MFYDIVQDIISQPSCYPSGMYWAGGGGSLLEMLFTVVTEITLYILHVLRSPIVQGALAGEGQLKSLP